MNHTQPKIAIFLVVLLMSLGLGCTKDDDTVPKVSVNILISTTDPQFNDLNAVGGWVYLIGGSQGLVVYRFSYDEFVAFDRHCTYVPSDNCRVEVDQSGVIVEDACCGSKFILTDGTVAEGPAAQPLKQYQTSFDGNLLHIFN